MRSDRSCTLADAAAELGVAGADARRHLGQRRGGRRRPRLLAGLEGLLQQRAAIGAGLVPGLPGGAAEPDEGVAIAPDLVVDDRLDDGLGGVLPGQQAQRLAIGGERGRPVAARQRHVAEVGMAARLVGVSEPDQLLLELERALEDRLGRIRAPLLDVDGAQRLQRLGHAGAAHAIDLLAHAHGLGVVALRGGEVAGFLRRQAQRVVLEAGLLVVRAVLADDERQGALGKAQRLGVVAGPIEGVRGLAQVLQLLGGLLGARAGAVSSTASAARQRTTRDSPGKSRDQRSGVDSAAAASPPPHAEGMPSA